MNRSAQDVAPVAELSSVERIEAGGEQELDRPRDHARRVPDRRAHPTPRFSRYTLFGGRRRGARREGEERGAFVDLYEPRLFALVAWVALMNVLDSFFTLYHLQAGGTEVNPIADALLRSGRTSFVVGKSILISLALLVLCLHKNFRLARLGLFLATAVYTALVGYHLLLLGRH